MIYYQFCAFNYVFIEFFVLIRVKTAILLHIQSGCACQSSLRLPNYQNTLHHYCRSEHRSYSRVAFAILVKVNILHPALQVEFADVHSMQSLLVDGTIRLSCNIAFT